MSRLPVMGQQRHVEYDLPASCSSSSVGLAPLSLSGSLPHSQAWTVVPEYNISLRQQKVMDPFESWKYDVQRQIDNMADKLQDSLEQHPDPSTRYFSAGAMPSSVEPDFERRTEGHATRQTQTMTSSLAYGLGRK